MCRICTVVPPGEPQVFLGPDKAFTYDYVFDTNATQSEIYDTCVARLVEGTLDGYNATVLAYGQTGSGKTYSMGTGFDVEIEDDVVGIIPRAIKHLFEGIAEKQASARANGQMPPEFKVRIISDFEFTKNKKNNSKKTNINFYMTVNKSFSTFCFVFCCGRDVLKSRYFFQQEIRT